MTIKKCSACHLCGDLKKNQLKPTGGIGKVRPYFILSEPNNWEENQNYTFISAPTAMTKILEDLKIEENFRAGYLLRCFPGYGVFPTLENYKFCFDKFLANDIISRRPEVLVICGDGAKQFFGQKRLLKTLRGKFFTVEVGGVKFPAIFTHSPREVQQGLMSGNEDLYYEWREDVQSALSMGEDILPDVRINVLSPEEFIEKVSTWLEQTSLPLCGWDIETNDLSPFPSLKQPNPKIIGFSVAFTEDEGFYIPLSGRGVAPISESVMTALISAAKQLLEKKKVVAHNFKFDGSWAKVLWKFTPNLVADTMVNASLLYRGLYTKKGSFSLKNLCSRKLGMPHWEKVVDFYKLFFDLMEKKKKAMKTLQELFLSSQHFKDCFIKDDFDSIYATMPPTEAKKLSKKIEAFKKERKVIIEEKLPYRMLQKDVEGIFTNEYFNEMFLKDSFNYGDIPVGSLSKYGAIDAVAALRLHNFLEKEIDKWDEGLRQVVNLMTEGVKSFTNIELKGWKVINLEKYMRQYLPLVEDSLEELRKYAEVQAYEFEETKKLTPDKNGNVVPHVYNPNSTHHNEKLFFNFFHFKPTHFSPKTKKPSASEDAILDLIDDFDKKKEAGLLDPREMHKSRFLATFRNFKKYSKVYNTYLEGFKSKTKTNSSYDGRYCKHMGDKDSQYLHPGYSLHTVQTGRLASVNPSLHTIPKYSEGKKILTSTYHDRGGLILTADQSQLEVRVFAAIIKHRYGDSSMCEAFEKGADIHRFVASIVYNKEMDEVSDHERSMAKSSSFGILYGSSEPSIAKKTGASLEQVNHLFTTLFTRFPGIKQYIKDEHVFADEHGYVRTFTGRIRWLPRLSVGERHRRAQNTPVQGAGSDISIFSINYMQAIMEMRKMFSHLVGFVHDSLQTDVAPGELYDTMLLKLAAMRDLPRKYFKWLDVVLGIDLELGTTWGDDLAKVILPIKKNGEEISFILKGKKKIIQDIKAQMDIWAETEFTVEKEETKTADNELKQGSAIHLGSGDSYVEQTTHCKYLKKNAIFSKKS